MEGLLLSDRYKLLEKIGQGGFATVWRVQDELLERQVAVKLMDPRLLEWDGQVAVRQFMREARTVAALRHPNIIHVYDMGQEGSHLFLVMELMADDLTARLTAHGPYALPEALAVLEPAAAALDAAHAAGLVHRDVKPQNILFDQNGRVALTDFGLVKSLSGTSYASRTVYSSNRTLGTPEYMAPEQAEGREVDARTDLYALAVILFQLLTGAPPFKGETPLSTLYQAAHNSRQELAGRLPANLPAAAAELLLAALAVAPDKRPGRAGEWVAGLQSSQKVKLSQVLDRKTQERHLDNQGTNDILYLHQGKKAYKPAQQAKWGKLNTSPQAPITATNWPATLAGWLRLVPDWGWGVGILLGLATLFFLLSPAGTGVKLPPLEAQLGDEWLRSVDEMEMVYVPPPGESVELGNDVMTPLEAYWIDKHPITNAQYQLCVDAGACSPSGFADDSRFNGDNYPVVGVSWFNAIDYVSWLNETLSHRDKWHYALPDEVMWEYAAVGDSGWNYPWGDEFDDTLLNFCDANCMASWKDYDRNDDYKYTVTVGSYPDGASWIGAVDMAGNVWEWTDSWWDEDEARRVLRGSSWPNDRYGAHAAYRLGTSPAYHTCFYGFRVVLVGHSSISS